MKKHKESTNGTTEELPLGNPQNTSSSKGENSQLIRRTLLTLHKTRWSIVFSNLVDLRNSKPESLNPKTSITYNSMTSRIWITDHKNTSRRSWSSIPFPSNLFRSCEFSREIFFSFFLQFTIGHSGDRVWVHSAVLWGVHRNEPYTVSPRYPQPRQTYISEAGPCSVAALGGRWWGFPGIPPDLSTDHSPTTCPR